MMRAIPRTIIMHSRPSGGLASFPTDATRATPLSTSVAPHDRAAGFPGGHHRFRFPCNAEARARTVGASPIA